MIPMVRAHLATWARIDWKLRLTVPALLAMGVVGLGLLVAARTDNGTEVAIPTVFGVILGFVLASGPDGGRVGTRRREWPLLPVPPGVRRLVQILLPTVVAGLAALTFAGLAAGLDRPAPWEPPLTPADLVRSVLLVTAATTSGALAAAALVARAFDLPPGRATDRWIGAGLVVLVSLPLVAVGAGAPAWAPAFVALTGLLALVVPAPRPDAGRSAGPLGLPALPPERTVARLVARSTGRAYVLLAGLAGLTALATGGRLSGDVPLVVLPIVASLAALATGGLFATRWRPARTVGDWLPMDPAPAWRVALVVGAGCGTLAGACFLRPPADLGLAADVLLVLGGPLAGGIVVAPPRDWSTARAWAGIGVWVGWVVLGGQAAVRHAAAEPVGVPVVAALTGLLVLTLLLGFAPARSPR